MPDPTMITAQVAGRTRRWRIGLSPLTPLLGAPDSGTGGSPGKYAPSEDEGAGGVASAAFFVAGPLTTAGEITLRNVELTYNHAFFVAGPLTTAGAGRTGWGGG